MVDDFGGLDLGVTLMNFLRKRLPGLSALSAIRPHDRRDDDALRWAFSLWGEGVVPWVPMPNGRLTRVVVPEGPNA